jgi:hypothetical protein
MNIRVGRNGVWTSLVASYKLRWGKQTHDLWLQLEGRRLKYPAQLANNAAFAQPRSVSRAPR